MAIIISGFPGVGKTYLKNNIKDFNIADSDSSKFSHIIINEKKVPNDKFPNNYMEHIESLMNDHTTDIILVSTHEVVRDELMKRKIPFTIVYPDKKFKNEYVGRYYNRNSPDSFIKLIHDNFEKWVTDIECINDENVNKIKLKEYGSYLSNIIPFLIDELILKK